ncbi:MAG: plasmid pRiA4b ORF-3 family protein [Fusobacteriota bacterium]
MNINCTGKLRKELDFEIKSIEEEKTDDFYNWHANLIKLNRRKCVLLMNVKTKYVIFLYGLKKAEFKKLDEIILKSIRKVLEEDRIDKKYIEKYFNKIDEINFTKTYSRSVISHMRDPKMMLEAIIGGYLPIENIVNIPINLELNRRLMLNTKYEYGIDYLENELIERFGRNYDKVYRVRITLRDIEPKIWRVIEIPANYTFFDLNVAIQGAVGWKGYHMHEFQVRDKMLNDILRIGVPSDLNDELPSWTQKISDYMKRDIQEINYIYDFGDYWEHRIEIEDVYPAKEDIEYPRCLDGELAGPLEDSGGPGGYEEVFEAMKPKDESNLDEEYRQQLVGWIPSNYQPSVFNPKEVSFKNPGEILLKKMGKVETRF